MSLEFTLDKEGGGFWQEENLLKSDQRNFSKEGGEALAQIPGESVPPPSLESSMPAWTKLGYWNGIKSLPTRIPGFWDSWILCFAPKIRALPWDSPAFPAGMHISPWAPEGAPRLIPRRNFALEELHSHGRAAFPSLQIHRSHIPRRHSTHGASPVLLDTKSRAKPNSQIPKSPNSRWEGKLGECKSSPCFSPSHHSFPCAAFPPLPNSSFIPGAAPDGRNSKEFQSGFNCRAQLEPH